MAILQCSTPHISWRRKWQPTPVLLPGKFQGWRILVGYSSWGHKNRTRLSNFTLSFPHISSTITGKIQKRKRANGYSTKSQASFAEERLFLPGLNFKLLFHRLTVSLTQVCFFLRPAKQGASPEQNPSCWELLGKKAPSKEGRGEASRRP